MASQTILKTEEKFYKDAANYWSEIPATVDGMLGGFGHISEIDIRSSKSLLKQLFNSKQPPGREYALDCGAGIGRITKFLLSDLFEKVDMVEQNPLFLEKARNYVGMKTLERKIGQMYPIGLQSFKPEPHKYDVIWVQWVLGHLTDDDFVKFLESCQKGLKPNGVIVAKENITSSEAIEVDEKDSSVTRPLSLLKKLFEKANLDCYRLVKQHNFPKGIYTVYMFVLKPKQQQINISNEITNEQVNTSTTELIDEVSKSNPKYLCEQVQNESTGVSQMEYEQMNIRNETIGTLQGDAEQLNLQNESTGLSQNDGGEQVNIQN